MISDLEIGEIRGWNSCLKYLNDSIGDALRNGAVLTQIDFEKLLIELKKDESILP